MACLEEFNDFVTYYKRHESKIEEDDFHHQLSKLAKIKNDIIGNNLLFKTPFG